MIKMQYNNSPLSFRVMSTGKAQTEIACTLSWFNNWSQEQKEQFWTSYTDVSHQSHSEDNASLDSLTSQLNDISLNKKHVDGPSVFECQLKIFKKWYSCWDLHAKKDFSNQFKSKYPDCAAILQ